MLVPAGKAALFNEFLLNLHVKLERVPVNKLHLSPLRVIIKSEKTNPTDPESLIDNVNVSADNEAAVTKAVLVTSKEYAQFKHTAGMELTLR